MSDAQPQPQPQPGDGSQGTPDDQELDEPQEVDREAQEAAAAKALEEGRFVAAESDDNAIATSDSDFIGVSPEYQEYADDRLMPRSAPEDSEEGKIEQRTKEHEAALLEQSTVGNNRTGFSTKGLKHPSEARQPAADLIDKQRSALDRSSGSR